MDNFVLQNPTKILFGRNTLPAIGAEIAVFGKNVLLVYGRSSIKTSGIYSQVVSSLQEAGAKITEHSGVQPNPIHSHLVQGIELCKNSGCDVMCAVGGGSTIDEAKAISAGALVNHDVWKFLTGKKSVKKALPVTAVPTLAASGSEANSGIVISHDLKIQKLGFGNRHLFPKTSILDPEITFSVPPNHTAFGAIDTISHMLEFYCTTSTKESSIQDTIIEGLINNIIESTNRCLEVPNDYHARANLMWAASLSLNGLISSGLGKVQFPMHLLEHSLSALYDISHGAGLAITIPGWMSHRLRTSPHRIAELGRKAFRIDMGSEDETAQATIEYLKEWFKKIGAPTNLQDIDIGESEISTIAANALPQAKTWRMREISQATIEEMLHCCLAKKLV